MEIGGLFIRKYFRSLVNIFKRLEFKEHMALVSKKDRKYQQMESLKKKKEPSRNFRVEKHN